MSCDQFTCVYCKKYLLDDPIRCTCGDILCTSCFENFSANREEFECYKCRAVISVVQCSKDRNVAERLKDTLIQCSAPGCYWEGHGEEYLEHIAYCDNVIVCCKMREYGCGELLPRKVMKAHEANCSFAFQTCKWCGSTIQDENTHLAEECVSVPLSCPEGCSSKISRIEMAGHLENECPCQKKKCEFSFVGCHYIGNSKELEEHCAADIMKHVQLLNKFLTNLASQELKIAKLTQSVQELQEATHDGSFIWKITEVERHRNEEITGKKLFLRSTPFFSHSQGYKVCMALYLNGDGEAKNNHLSLFINIMIGEYDALLEWPFKHMVYLSLLDQDGGNHIVECLKPDENSVQFGRCLIGINGGAGFWKFAPLSVLRQQSYVKDDTMFVKCQIKAWGINLL